MSKTLPWALLFLYFSGDGENLMVILFFQDKPPFYLLSNKRQGFQSIPGWKRLSTVAEFNTLGTLPFLRITDSLTWSSKLFSHAKAESLKVSETSKRSFFHFAFHLAQSPQHRSPFKGRSQGRHDFQTPSLGRKGGGNRAANAVCSTLATVPGKSAKGTPLTYPKGESCSRPD